MSNEALNTYYAGGLALLTTGVIMIAWLLWRERDDRMDAAAAALVGVGHELRINLQRMVREIAQVSEAGTASANSLLPITHPQLDGVNASTLKTNRLALSVIGSTYQELQARKMDLRAAIAQGRDLQPTIDDAMDATIDGITTLYMWEEHAGARPKDATSTRSWHVRDWMKANGFASTLLPGIHLRDEVVERLRDYGLTLTPKPLTHTAHEYYSMRYDRMADVHGPMGRRKDVGASQKFKLPFFGKDKPEPVVDADPAILDRDSSLEIDDFFSPNDA